jgi:peptide methionine sulfoxide reductase MsrB
MMSYIMTRSRRSANNDRQVKNVRKEKLTSEEHEACRIKELITTDPKTVNTFFRPVPVLVCERYFSNFDSDTKFDSGTGWPCLWAPAKMQDLKSLVYKTYGMQRIEVQYNNSGVTLLALSLKMVPLRQEKDIVSILHPQNLKEEKTFIGVITMTYNQRGEKI